MLGKVGKPVRNHVQRSNVDVSMESVGEGWLESVADTLSDVEFSDVPDCVVQFTVSGASGGVKSFWVEASSGRLNVSAGRHQSPDVSLNWILVDLIAALRGDLPPEVAYMSGNMKLEGDQVLLFDAWRSLRASTSAHDVRQRLVRVVTSASSASAVSSASG